MAGVVIDELITKLEYEANPEVLRAAESAVKALDQQNKAAAETTDKLSAESRKLAEHTDALSSAQLDLAEQLAETSNKAAALRDEQRALEVAAKKAGGASQEQERRLKELEHELQQTDRASRELREESKRLGIAKSKVGQEARKLAREQKDVASSSRKAAEDQRKLSTAMRTATENAKSEASGLDSLAEKIQGVAGGQLAADAVQKLAGGVFDLGKDVITTGANFESLRMRLKTVEGSADAAGNAFRMIKDFAKATPFEVEGITEAFTALRVRGVKPTTEMLTGLGDVASSFGTDFKTMTDAIASASRGEFEPIRQYGVQMKKVGDQLEVTFKGQTTTIAMNNAAVSELVASYGKLDGIQGAMAEQMGTTAGMFSNLQDTISALFDQIAQMGVLDEVKLLMAALSESMGGEGGLAKVIADVLVIALKTLRGLFEAMPEGALLEFLQQLVSLVGMVAEVLVSSASEGSSFVSTLFEMGAKLLEVAGAVYGLLKRLDEIRDKFEGLPGPVDLVLKGITLLLTPLGILADWLTKLIKIVDPFLERISTLGDKLPSLGDVFSGLGAAASGFAGDLGILNNKLESTISVAQNAFDALEQLRKQGDYSGKTDQELQELRQSGDEKAEAEVSRRVKQRTQDEESDVNEKRAKSKKEAQSKKVDEIIADSKKTTTRAQLVAIAKDPNLTEKQRAKAQAALDKRDVKAKKAGAKAGKKLHDSLLTAQIEKDIEKLAQEAGQRESARALLGGASHEEANKRELSRRKQVKSQLTDNFKNSGALPPGMSQDLVAVSQLPNLELTGGRLAPPVITVNNTRVEVTGNTFEANVSVGGTSATPADIANAALNQARPVLFEDLGRAIVNNMTTMRR